MITVGQPSLVSLWNPPDQNGSVLQKKEKNRRTEEQKNRRTEEQKNRTIENPILFQES